MDVKDLRCFIAVYETGGFSRGARAIDTVQSNVSTRIRKLELAIGGELFERRHRSVVPTTKGRMLYDYARRILAIVQECEQALRQPVAPPDRLISEQPIA